MQQRTHIGVTTETSVQSSPTNTSVPSGRFQVAGITVKGPLNHPGVITSINEYIDLFGGRAPYETLYDTVRTYFQEGGAELVVTRVVGSAATNGSVTLETAGDTPVDAVTIEVVDPGEHSATYQVLVTANTDNTFNVTVHDTTTSRVIAQFTRAESGADLASLALGGEAVRVSDLGVAGVLAPGAFNLTAGTDDRASVTSTTFKDALDVHKGVRAGVAAACPLQHPTAISASLGEHCANTGKIGLLEIPAGASISEAKAIGAALKGSAYSPHLSMPIYPAIRIPDGNDRTRVSSPVGYAAAKRSLIHRESSFAQAVAGKSVATIWNFQPVTRLSNTDVNELNQSGVNAIESSTGAPFLNNWSSLSEDPGLYDLNVMDALNNLTVLIEDGLSGLVWRPNEGRGSIMAEARSVIDGIMAPLVEGGYLFATQDAEGNLTDSGYSVQVEDIRVSGQPAPYDRVQVAVGVKLSPTLRHIHVPIRKVDLRSTL